MHSLNCQSNHRHSIFCIVPPHVLREIARNGNAAQRNAALANEETALNIRQNRLVASAALIQALGGGWDATQLRGRERIEEDAPFNFSPFPPRIDEARTK